jgi:hypothetical protein
MSVEVHPQFLVDAEGKPQSVLLSIAEYEALMDRIEDFEDALIVHQMSQTATADDFEDWEIVKDRLRKQGTIK